MFIENLLSLIKEKGITRKKLAEDLSFGVNQIKYWETHGNIPSGEVLQKIADYFNVTVDYLLTGEQKEKALQDIPEGLNDLDAEIIKIYSNLPEEKKQQALSYLEFLLKQDGE